MIRMELAEIPPRGTGAPTYSAGTVWDGAPRIVTTRGEPSCKLARLLVELGCPDQPWEAWQGGTRAMSGRSLHRWAGLTVVEPDRGRASFVKFTAMPDGAHQAGKSPPAPSSGAPPAAPSGLEVG
jgi:hypothetical protein